jgi:hypothetical protein
VRYTKFRIAEKIGENLVMFKKVVISVFIILAFCYSEVAAQQDSSKSASKPILKTKYETFVAPTDKIFITQSYPIAELKNNGYRVSVLVSYALGEKERVYAASFGEQIIDFEQLEPLQKRLDELIQTIKSFDQLEISSVSYRLPKGLSVSYYSWRNSEGKEFRNLYLVVGMSLEQSLTSIEPLEKLRDFVAQARAKIISLQTK